MATRHDLQEKKNLLLLSSRVRRSCFLTCFLLHLFSFSSCFSSYNLGMGARWKELWWMVGMPYSFLRCFLQFHGVSFDAEAAKQHTAWS